MIPHKRFTFAKVWLLYAQFEIRRKDILKARQALGTALGKCPKAKLFRGYIDLEIQLREFHRYVYRLYIYTYIYRRNGQEWLKIFFKLRYLLKYES